jgi:hypothetical protein
MWGRLNNKPRPRGPAAEEVEPWTVDPIPGYTTACNLRNKTGTPKYGATVTGEFVSGPNSFDFIGPFDSEQSLPRRMGAWGRIPAMREVGACLL